MNFETERPTPLLADRNLGELDRATGQLRFAHGSLDHSSLDRSERAAPPDLLHREPARCVGGWVSALVEGEAPLFPRLEAPLTTPRDL